MTDDLRQTLRSLSRARVATAVLLLSLALGTGVNATLYSVMDALLFRPPAGVSHASRLAWVFTSQFNGASYGPSSYPDFESIQAAAPSFVSLAAFNDTEVTTVSLGDTSQRVRVVRVTPGFFATIGMEAAHGTLLDRPPVAGSPPPAVISDALWTSLGRPADVVGREVRIGASVFVVTGVAPARFSGLQLARASDVWIPLDALATQSGRGDRRLAIVGRLRDGQRLSDASRELDALAGRLAERYPDSNRGTRTDNTAPRRLTARQYSRLDAAAREQVLVISTVVLGSTGMLLLSACVNAGNLLLSRSAARRRELAVKLALGASRGTLVRQVIVESLFVAGSGAALGLLIAHWTASALPATFAPEEAAMLDTSLSVPLMLTVVVLAVLAAAGFAIGPARHALEAVDVLALRGDAGAISEPTGGRLRGAIVVGQVALSTVLLIASGLMARALSIGLEGDLARDGRGVAVVLVRMPGALEGDVTRGIVFHVAALDAARRMPAAEAAGWVSVLPVDRATRQAFSIDTGHEGLVEHIEADVNVATGGYFTALRIPIVEGRTFGDQDVALSKPVVMVNDLFARRYFGESAVGRRVRDTDGQEFEIVGVAGSGKYRTLQESPEPMVYFPFSQRDQQYMHLLVRTVGRPEPALAALPPILTGIDAGLSVRRQVTFDQHLAEALTLDRILTTVVAACGIAALILATMGVSGVIADAVRRRTAEIGLRVALGAPGWRILRLVFGEGVPLTLAGAGAGIAMALLLARVLRAFVHAIPSIGLATLAIVPASLLIVVAGAAALPVRRALRVSPTVALRAG